MNPFCPKNLAKTLLKRINTPTSVLPVFLGQDITELDSSQSALSENDEIEILDNQRFNRQAKKVQTISSQQSLSSTIKKKDTAHVDWHLQKKSQQPLSILPLEDDLISTESISHEITPPERLCCRSYFIKGQRLGPESRSIQYKHYDMSNLHKILQYIIAKAITAFLNCNGGNIFIGVQQTQEFQRFVVGGKYSEADKEAVYKKLRTIAQTIKPEIIASQLFEVSFVPVVHKNSNSGKILPLKNTFVIKISVHQGHPTKLYTVMNHSTGLQEVCIRTQNEVIIYRQMHQAFKLLEDRWKFGKTLQNLYPHQNPCNPLKLQNNYCAAIKRQKKPFKTNTKLEGSSNSDKNGPIPEKQKKLIIYAGDIPTEQKFGENQLKKAEIITGLEKKKTESPKIEGKTQIPTVQMDKNQRQEISISSSESPYLFKQLNSDEVTEFINY